MSELLIEIKDLECNIDNQKILQGLNLKINKGRSYKIWALTVQKVLCLS